MQASDFVISLQRLTMLRYAYNDVEKSKSERQFMNKCNVIFLLVTTACYLQVQAMAVDTKQAKETTQTVTPQKMIICVPIADVRTEPKEPVSDIKLPTNSTKNPLQETQMLFGEHLLAFEEADGWIRIQALEQKKYRNNTWQGYPGWIKKSQATAVTAFPENNLVVVNSWASIYGEKESSPLFSVSIGTKLKGIKVTKNHWTIIFHDGTEGKIASTDVYSITSKVTEKIDDLRKQAVSAALTFKDNYYSWGGRSAQSKDFLVSSIDCSALINLSYLTLGLQLPRDAHDQFLYATPIEKGSELQVGDVIFLASKQKNRVRHVMMYIGDEKLIEATYSNDVDHVRVVSVKEKLGISLDQIKQGQENNDIIIYLGSFLNSSKTINLLRAEALRSTYD